MAEYIDKAEALSRFSFYNGDRIPERDVEGFQNTITFHDAKAVIRSIRAADVRPVVRGRWIEKPYLLGTTNVCSVCGENYGMPHGKYNFCPRCGADMRGE